MKKKIDSKTDLTLDATKRTGNLVVNWFNYSLSALGGEENNSPSLTVPDDSMDIKEIVSRFVRRGQLPIEIHSRDPIYNGDDELPDFEAMDHVDREQFRMNNGEWLAHQSSLVNPPKEGETPSPEHEDAEIIQDESASEAS
jgi:hypothetical protein